MALGEQLENFESLENTQNSLLHRAKKIGAIAMSGLALSWAALEAGREAWWERADSSGTMIDIKPSNHASNESSYHPGNELRIVSWNMARAATSRIDDIKAIIKRENVDVFVLQEVTSNDVQALSELASEGWHITFAIGDARQKRDIEWQGITILTRQPQQEMSARSIRGTTYHQTVFGALLNVLEGTAHAAIPKTSSQNSVDNSQEDRVAQVSTIEVPYGGSKVKLKIINAHITPTRKVSYIYGSKQMHDNQLNELMGMMRHEAKGGSPVIIAVDSNSPPEQMLPVLNAANFAAAPTGPTFIKNKLRPDYIAINPGKLGSSIFLSETKVLPEHTDHYAIFARYVLPEPENLLVLKHARPESKQQQKRNELKLRYRK